jgi:hypothetical protein
LAYGKGKGQFESPVVIWDDPPPLGFNWIEAGDFNNDGWMDLMATEGQCLGNYYVMLNNHMGGFRVTTTSTKDYPCTFMLGDFNDDGNLDAVLQYGNVEVSSALRPARVRKRGSVRAASR